MVHQLLMYRIFKITWQWVNLITKALASTGGANTVSNSGTVGTNINVTGNVGGSTANATLSTAQLASHSHSGN